jgi:LemA protein
MTPLLTAFAIVALALVWGVLAFNGLVRARNRVDEAWSGVDVQLKRRCDLVPNLVAAVRGYAQHEREVLEAVAEARSAALGAANRGQRERTESGLSHCSRSYERLRRAIRG